MLGGQQPWLVRNACLVCYIMAAYYVGARFKGHVGRWVSGAWAVQWALHGGPPQTPSATLKLLPSPPRCLQSLTYRSQCSEFASCYDDLRMPTDRSQGELAVRMIWQPTDGCDGSWEDCDFVLYSRINHLLGQLTAAALMESDQYQPERIKPWFEGMYATYSQYAGSMGQPLIHGAIAYVIGMQANMSYEDVFSHICFSRKTFFGFDMLNECLHGVGFGYLLNAYWDTMDFTGCTELRAEVDTYLYKAIDACDNIGPLNISTHCFFGLYHNWFKFFDYKIHGYNPMWPCDGGQVPQLSMCYFGHFIMARNTNPALTTGNHWHSCLAKPTEDTTLACIQGLQVMNTWDVSRVLDEFSPIPWDVCTPANLTPESLDDVRFDTRLRACYKGALSGYGFWEQIKRLSAYSPSAALNHINRTCTIPRMSYTAIDLSELCIESVSNLFNGASAYRMAVGIQH